MPSTTSTIGLGGLALLDRDHAVLADLLEGVGHDLADRGIVVGRNRGDRLDIALALDGLAIAPMLSVTASTAFHAADQGVGVSAGRELLQSLT
jgi:hypothetical protein